MEKLNQVTKKLREAGKNEVQAYKDAIAKCLADVKEKLLLQVIPNRIKSDLHYEEFKKVEILNKTKQYATLIIREVCERQIQPDTSDAILKVLLKIVDLSASIGSESNSLLFYMGHMDADDYSNLLSGVTVERLDLASV